MKYDAVIVGGGPVGAHVADHIARAGYSVLILEEHKIAGLPVQCAGLVTTKIENLVPLKNCILNTVLGARIYSPSGHMLELDSKTPKAHVIDRTLFDQQILESAVSAGAELRLSSRVTEAKRIAFEDTEGVELKVYFDNKPTSIRTKLVIGADGANSKIREVFGFPGPKMILRGFGMEFEYRDIPKLLKKEPRALAEMNPETAEKMGISNGDEIILENKMGSITIIAHLTKDILPDIINVPHGWETANINKIAVVFDCLRYTPYISTFLYNDGSDIRSAEQLVSGGQSRRARSDYDGWFPAHLSTLLRQDAPLGHEADYLDVFVVEIGHIFKIYQVVVGTGTSLVETH